MVGCAGPRAAQPVPPRRRWWLKSQRTRTGPLLARANAITRASAFDHSSAAAPCGLSCGRQVDHALQVRRSRDPSVWRRPRSVAARPRRPEPRRAAGAGPAGRRAHGRRPGSSISTKSSRGSKSPPSGPPPSGSGQSRTTRLSYSRNSMPLNRRRQIARKSTSRPGQQLATAVTGSVADRDCRRRRSGSAR